jgi:hypothetical protein
MDIPVLFHPSAAGLSFAAAAVAVGAPWFSDGLRTLWLNRLFGRLRAASLADAPEGFTLVKGQVTLESPLFSPISGKPCAGYRLEVRGLGTPVARTLDDFRPFRIAAEGVSARVDAVRARWNLSETARCDVPPGQGLSQNVEALLERVPEAAWLRRSGATLRLVERALVGGGECHVVGYARRGRPLEVAYETELARTGTDDVETLAAAIPAESASEPELRLEAGEHPSFLLVSDLEPRPERLAIPRARAIGLVAGPLLTLLGILYFAHTADYLRSLGTP